MGRISNSVPHSYWSLDTNNGRAKEDWVCACTPCYPFLLSSKVIGKCMVKGGEAAYSLLGGQVHLEDWPARQSDSSPPP